MSKAKMICPKCGAEMNHHAIKIEYGVDDPALTDSTFEGAPREVHTCPQCGDTESQAAE